MLLLVNYSIHFQNRISIASFYLSIYLDLSFSFSTLKFHVTTSQQISNQIFNTFTSMRNVGISSLKNIKHRQIRYNPHLAFDRKGRGPKNSTHLVLSTSLSCSSLRFHAHPSSSATTVAIATQQKRKKVAIVPREGVDFVWSLLWTASPVNIADGRLKREWKRIPSLYMHRWKVNAPRGSFRGPFDSDLGSTVFVRGWITPCAARFNRRCSRYAD